MGKILACEIHEYGVEGGAGHPRFTSLAAETEPDEVDRTADSHEESNEQEVGGVEEVVCKPPGAAPEKEAREEVAENCPECILFSTL